KPGLAFAQADAPPPGDTIAETSMKLGELPAELVAVLGPVDTEVGVALVFDGEHAAFALHAGGHYWIARVNVRDILQTLTGAVDLATQKLGDLAKLGQRWKKKTAAGGHLRLDLWDANFVVIDLARAIAGVAHGSVAGFRPIEAKLDLGNTAGAAIFA